MDVDNDRKRQCTTQQTIQSLVGKKVEVSLRLFDIFEKKGGSCKEVVNLHRPNEPSNKTDRVSKLDNSLSFGAKQKSLGQIFFEL